MTTSATAPDPLDDVFDSAWLTEQDFPPVEYVVPGVIPEGLTILVAPPKVGKSWMVLGIAEAAASGGPGIRCHTGKASPGLIPRARRWTATFEVQTQGNWRGKWKQ